MEIKCKCSRWKVMNCEKWFVRKLRSRLKSILSVSHKMKRHHEFYSNRKVNLWGKFFLRTLFYRWWYCCCRLVGWMLVLQKFLISNVGCVGCIRFFSLLKMELSGMIPVRAQFYHMVGVYLLDFLLNAKRVEKYTIVNTLAVRSEFFEMDKGWLKVVNKCL